MNRIWIINHYAGDMYFNEGGRHYWFAKYLKQKGYNPIVFCCNVKHNPGSEVFFNTNRLWSMHLASTIDTPFIFVKSNRYKGNGLSRIINMFGFYFNMIIAGIDYAKKYGKPDVILASSVHPLTLIAGLNLARVFNVKCICEIRDFWPESIVEYSTGWKKENPIIKMLYLEEKRMYKKADALIFTPEGGYDYIVEKGWEKVVPRSKCFYINNGIDLEVFNSNKEKYHLIDEDLSDTESFNVIYTGSIRKVNNVGLILDVAKKVTNPKVRFLIWGDGNELQVLERRVKEEHINNVVFKGRVEKKYIASITSRADLNYMHGEQSPILRFGLSLNKMFDYIAAGKPVLSDINSRFNPIVEYGIGKQLLITTPETIAREIERMSMISEEEKKIIQTNAQRAANDFDFKALTKKLITVIEGVKTK